MGTWQRCRKAQDPHVPSCQVRDTHRGDGWCVRTERGGGGGLRKDSAGVWPSTPFLTMVPPHPQAAVSHSPRGPEHATSALMARHWQ